MPRDLSFAIWARVAAFAAVTFLQAAALRLERKELEDGLAVGLGLVAMVLVAMVLDLVVAVAAAPEADEIDTAVVAVVLEGVVEVERAEVAEVAGACELEATVVRVVLEDAATIVSDVATDDTIACGAASAVAAKSRTRDVGFILMECCRIEKRRLGML